MAKSSHTYEGNNLMLGLTSWRLDLSWELCIMINLLQWCMDFELSMTVKCAMCALINMKFWCQSACMMKQVIQLMKLVKMCHKLVTEHTCLSYQWLKSWATCLHYDVKVAETEIVIPQYLHSTCKIALFLYTGQHLIICKKLVIFVIKFLCQSLFTER